jgi:hypothetical protein
MKIYSTYSVKIKQYNHIFSETVTIYRDAVNFLMDVCLAEWDLVSAIKGNQAQMMYVESLCHKTKENSSPKYDFDSRFYTFLNTIFGIHASDIQVLKKVQFSKNVYFPLF